MGRGAHGGFGHGGFMGPRFGLFGPMGMWGPMWFGLWFGPPWMRGPLFLYFAFLLLYCIGVSIFSSIYYSTCDDDSAGFGPGRRGYDACGAQQAVGVFSLLYFFALIFCVCGGSYYCRNRDMDPEMFETFVDEGGAPPTASVSMAPPMASAQASASASAGGEVPVARPIKD